MNPSALSQNDSKVEVLTTQQNGNGSCPDCLDQSTVGQNLFYLTYPGGNNPLAISGDYSYSYVPSILSEFPSLAQVYSFACRW